VERRHRDTIRRYWKGDWGQVGELAFRLTGSSDLTRPTPARTRVNFVTAHDGFTLADLVSYDGKNNEANGEDNRDGTTTTSRGTAAPRARPTTPRSSRSASGRCGTSS
jgi:glycogen operon protein